MGLIDNLLVAFRGVGQDYKRLAAKVDAMPEPVRDTGWRQINQGTGYRLNNILCVRRAGDRCLIALHKPGTTEGSLALLPVGFRPLGDLCFPVYGRNNGRAVVAGALTSATEYFSCAYLAQEPAQIVTPLVAEYFTKDPFPTVLPGRPWTPT